MRLMRLFALAQPCMSRTAPLSVARTLSTSSAPRDSSSFLALAMGMGHFRPRASRVFSTYALLIRSAARRSRQGRRALVLPQLPLRRLLAGHVRGREVGRDDLAVHLGRRLHGAAHGLDEGRLRRQAELRRGGAGVAEPPLHDATMVQLP